MKRHIRASGLTALTLSALTTMNCTTEKVDAAYIGPSQIEIQDGKMTPEVLLSLGRLSDPQLSPDGKIILYGVSYTSIEENRSCRNLFIVNADGTSPRQLTKDGKSISCARWIDGGKAIAYIKDGQIWKATTRGLSGDNPKLVKRTKLSDVPNGVGEFKISPDETKIMYVSYIHSDVKTPKDTDPKLDKARAYVAEDLMYRHWDHWVTELPHTFVADFKEGIRPENSTDILAAEKELYELPIEPHGGMSELDWSPDGKFIAYSCKKKTGKQYAFSTNTEIYIYNVADGSCTVIPMGGGYDTAPLWSPDGTKIAWLSMARDGYEADKTRLMIADFADGKISNIRDLTADFKYNAAGPVWTADSKSIYFNALAEGLQGIFRVNADGSITRITKENAWYDYDSPFAIVQNGEETQLLASWCSMDFPTELVKVAVADGKSEQITHENEHILSQLAEHKTEARMVKTVDGKDMLTWVLYPPQFDSTKTYPGIVICLGGPQGTLSQSWSYRWNYRLMSAQGYVVALPKRRGTTAFGQEWC